MVNYLRVVLGKIDFYEPIIPLIKEGLEKSGQNKIIDLCSGCGGSIEQVMKKIKHKHPGQILKKYYLDEMEITAYRLAIETKMSQIRVSEIINGKRAITANTAMRLSKFFGNSARFWMNLQNNYDMTKINKKDKKAIDSLDKYQIALIGTKIS